MATVDAEAAALFALAEIPGLSLAGVRELIRTRGSGVRALEHLRGASPADLLKAAGRVRVTKRTGPALATLSPAAFIPRLARVRERGLRVVPFGAPDYPAVLDELVDPPPVLFTRGGEWHEWDRCVAIVGTRRSTAYGRSVAHRLARDLARWGWSVVSGMARGIDAAAHAGALDGGGHTIGVLGSGHDHEYPSSNAPLYRRMDDGGLLVSEFWPEIGPTRYTFPRRNRIIAALARAVVVVEAGTRSGALNTASLATALGREILAVPGRIDAPSSRGVVDLLRGGAAPVAEVSDVFDAIGWVHDYASPAAEAERAERPGPPPRVGRSEDARVLRVLLGQGLTADETAAETGLDIGRALAALGRLEVDGRVVRGPGGRFELAACETPA